MSNPTNKEIIAQFKGIVQEAGTTVNDKGVVTIGVDPFNKCRDAAGISDEELKRVRKFSGNYVAAAHEVAGLAAVDVLAKNKDLTMVKTSIDMGEFGSASGKVNRQHVGVTPGTKDEVITYGTNNAKVVILSGSNATGINAAIEAVKAAAADKLK